MTVGRSAALVQYSPARILRNWSRIETCSKFGTKLAVWTPKYDDRRDSLSRRQVWVPMCALDGRPWERMTKLAVRKR
jgi:hypothetical protein